MTDFKIIAFYLPQYHPTLHNNEWWGKGFTEWTNVARAKPLFKGHEQPHIPGELGFYDLRLPENREAQTELAKEYGVYGFCYYYYRFSKGHNELELPLNEVLRTGKPDFPFMICWANESWNKKFWRYDGSCETECLAEQKYEGEQDYIDFFYEVLPFFRDNRYIRIDDKPAFMIYKPLAFNDVKIFIQTWQKLAQKEGLGGIYFIGYSLGKSKNESLNQIENCGFEGIALNKQHYIFSQRSKLQKGINFLYRKIIKRPYIVPYKNAIKQMIGAEHVNENVFPVILPNWDHTPRSGFGGSVFTDSTPDLFKLCIENALESQQKKNNKIIFLKSWNEWGEGNYVEPDLKYGRGYLKAIQSALLEFEEKSGSMSR